MSESLVLCYHAVSPTWAAPLSVTPDALERQLSWFLRHGWRGSTFSAAVLDPPSPRALAVTFDDAFASVFTLAYPVLQSLGLIATVFAPTAFMSARQPLTWSGIEKWAATPDAPELESMSWTEIHALSADGWEIGSHTRSHPSLPHLDDAALREELSLSREEVTQKVGRPCTSIAYPYGDVDRRVAEVAGDVGYLAGAALSRRLTPLGPLRWPRIGIYHGDHWQRFRIKASRPMQRLRGAGRPLPRGAVPPA